MNLGDALALIGMKVAWMQYAERLAFVEETMELDEGILSTPEWNVMVYCDPVYAWDGSRV